MNLIIVLWRIITRTSCGSENALATYRILRKSRIATNYVHKLPLIFKKWDILKGILGSYSAYNFDIIIDKDVRLNDSNKVSIISGGSKELKDSVREIVLHTRKQLHDFAGAGVVSWLQYIGGPKPIYQKVTVAII